MNNQDYKKLMNKICMLKIMLYSQMQMSFVLRLMEKNWKDSMLIMAFNIKYNFKGCNIFSNFYL